MDPETLVAGQLEEGRELLEHLGQNGVPVSAAAWVKETDGGLWFFYLVTPLAGRDQDTMEAYARINAAMDLLPEPLDINWMRIKAVSPFETKGRALLDIQSRHRHRRPMWYGGGNLGWMSIDGAYIYPPPAAAATRPE